MRKLEMPLACRLRCLHKFTLYSYKHLAPLNGKRAVVRFKPERCFKVTNRLLFCRLLLLPLVELLGGPGISDT